MFYAFVCPRWLPLLWLLAASWTLLSCKTKQPVTRETGQVSLGGFVLESSAHKTLIKAVSPWMGTPYKIGGTTQNGVDCSGFVQEIIRVVWGKHAPRSSREQFEWAKPLEKGKHAGGDLVFFRIRGPKISHVGLMLDAKHFVHASTSSGVRVDLLSTPYYENTWVGFGRIPSL
jgi:cell wall-associated NlpC family hydrolase